MPHIESDKNLISRSLWLMAMIIISLLVLHFVPEFHIGSFHFKKIDILSDIRPDLPRAKNMPVDSISKRKNDPAFAVSESKSSMTALEDFSGDPKPLIHFLNALKKSRRQPVRVAFYGDSFIEGDIISATLRDTLQQLFGGNGVGLVPLATEVSGFRKSIKHNHANWNIYSLITTPYAHVPFGISGFSYIPAEDNWVEYRPGKIPDQKDFSIANIFYKNKGRASLNYTINDEPEISKSLDPSDLIQKLSITHQDIRSLRFHTISEDSLVLFGTSFEDRTGIYIDNFSMRRNSGVALSKLSPSLLKQFNDYLDYKLIILQYGLNVASENDSTHYIGYAMKMINMINNLKAIFPQTSFLLLSVSDRSMNKDGNVVTMSSIPKLRDKQREIAKKCGIAFWDLYEAMGGENSIRQYTEAEPPLASKDYTHLTHLGGAKIGHLLAEALLEEFNKHEKKTKTP